MSGPSFRHLAMFRMSCWNKQIGSDDGIFRDQKASSDKRGQDSNDFISPMFTRL
jgi:hypothetical protein